MLQRALLVTAFVLSAAPAAGAPCTWWYETTAHGTAYRNVRDYGAIGDGVADDTAALRAALNADDTGRNGTGLAKSAAVVYVPTGTYRVSGTLVMWFWTSLVGNPVPGCASVIALSAASPGFGDPHALRPLLVANGGFNSTATDEAWWRTDRGVGGHANDLFYASVRDVALRVGAGNAGAVALYWPVAQQTALRSVDIALDSGAIGLDFGGLGYAGAPAPSIGGGGLVEGVRVRGGAVGVRLAGSQWSYVDVDVGNATGACLSSTQLIWTHTFVRLRAAHCPVALALSGAIGSVMLLDAALGPGLGAAAAVATDGTSGLYLQNVRVDAAPAGTRFVVDAALPVPPGGAPVGAWARGPVFATGVRADVNASGRALPLPSAAAAASAGMPLACRTAAGGADAPRLCGGSTEDPGTGLPVAPRPSFLGRAVDNAVTDFGAVGDGVADDTDALAAALARPNSVTFLPWGVYAVRGGALALGCNASLVGEALTTLALMANQSAGGGGGGGGGGGKGAPLVPLLTTAADAACSATVADVSLSSLGTGNDGAVLLDHAANGASGFYDVTMRIVYRLGLKARLGAAGGAGGAGVLSNTWWWGMDHNLTDMREMNCSAPGCVDHRPPGQRSGVRVGTAGPLFLVGTNFEHSSDEEYVFEPGAANVVATVIQTEGSQVSLNLTGTRLVTLFGGLFGSGSGKNATVFAARGGGNCVGGFDVSYRLAGVMQKADNFVIVDAAYAVPALSTKTGWEYAAAFYNECADDGARR